MVKVMVFNATFNNISVLLKEETGVPAASHWHGMSGDSMIANKIV
jgi:hypothetical protein